MTTGGNDATPALPALLTGSLTLILGIIVTAHPTGSLNVLAVLLGLPERQHPPPATGSRAAAGGQVQDPSLIRPAGSRLSPSSAAVVPAHP